MLVNIVKHYWYLNQKLGFQGMEVLEPPCGISAF